MSIVDTAITVLKVLGPVVEDAVKAIMAGKTPEFVQSLPSPLRSRVALEAKKAGLK